MKHGHYIDKAEELFNKKIAAGQHTGDKVEVFVSRLELRVLLHTAVEADRKVQAQNAVMALVQTLTDATIQEARDQAERALSPRPLPSPEILKALEDLNKTVKGLDA